MPCRINRKTEWRTKLYLEWKTWNEGSFNTLTYNDDNLPEKKYFQGGSLEKTDIQKFMKRFRKEFEKTYGKRMIRYFAVGEYGTRTKRAHYHMLLFNITAEETEKIMKRTWKLGNTKTDELHINRIKYTIDYTIKKETQLKDFPDGRVPEFSMMSRKPQLGAYALNGIAKKLKELELYPDRSLEREHKWRLREHNMKYWNGTFKQNGMYCRLDKAMMTKLASLVNPVIKENLDKMKEETLLIPKELRVFKNRELDNNYIDTINFELGEEHEQTKKKSEKAKRQIQKSIKHF